MNPAKQRQSTRRNSILIAAATLFTAATLHAGPDAATSSKEVVASITATPAPSIYDRIWGLATIYKDDSNPFIQELKLRGRYQGQYHWLDSEQGNDDAWEDRRSRFGIDAKLFDKKLELRFDVQSSDGFDPFYNGIVDAYLKWKPAEDFSLTVGRQKPQIGAFDFVQSSNYYPTFERSQIFNQLRVDRAVGAVAEGRAGNFTYQAGIYSNDIDLEFGQFDAGIAYGAGFGYDLKGVLNTQRADLRFDWLHSEIEEESNILDRYEDVFSATLWVSQGRWTFVTEAFAGVGNTPDVFGFYILPTYDIIPKKLQAVARYTFSTGDGPDSVIAQSRYERAAPELTGGGKGERYHAGYLGLQYFIYGDKLKLMGGVEYARLNGGGNGGDYDGWTALTGIRFFF
jgi:phosphate-selective porin OprO and OprP